MKPIISHLTNNIHPPKKLPLFQEGDHSGKDITNRIELKKRVCIVVGNHLAGQFHTNSKRVLNLPVFWIKASNKNGLV